MVLLFDSLILTLLVAAGPTSAPTSLPLPLLDATPITALASYEDQGRLRIVGVGGGGGGGGCTESNVLTEGASSCPLLTGSNLFGSYIGAWRLPSNDANCTYENMGAGKLSDLHLTSATSLYLTDGERLAEMNIPTLTQNADADSLNQGTFATNGNCINIIGDSNDGLFFDDTNGEQYNNSFLSALVGYGGHLYVGGYNYFTGEGPFSLLGLFKVTPPLNNAVIGDTVQGWDGDGVITTSTHAYTGHYADVIPAEWQTALGGPVFFGGSSGIPIIDRTTNGPSFIVIDPTQIGTTMVTGQGLLYYKVTNSSATLGEYAANIAPSTWGATASLGGCVAINETRTFACVYSIGTGATYGACYGAPDIINGNGCNGVIPPGGDPESGGEGYHAPPYVFKAMLFDLNKFKAVKDGTGGWTHENVAPYEVVTLTLPYDPAVHRVGGMAYDAVNHRLHFLQLRVWGPGDGWSVGLVYQVTGVTP